MQDFERYILDASKLYGEEEPSKESFERFLRTTMQTLKRKHTAYLKDHSLKTEIKGGRLSATDGGPLTWDTVQKLLEKYNRDS